MNPEEVFDESLLTLINQSADSSDYLSHLEDSQLPNETVSNIKETFSRCSSYDFDYTKAVLGTILYKNMGISLFI